MAENQDWQRDVEPASSVQSGEQVRRRMRPGAARQASAPGPAWNMNRLSIQRAVDTLNARKRELLPPGVDLEVETDGTTATLLLKRSADHALVHKSRALPLALISPSNVSGMLRDFLSYKSLERYENPL
jgi:hypothetical protein